MGDGTYSSPAGPASDDRALLDEWVRFTPLPHRQKGT